MKCLKEGSIDRPLDKIISLILKSFPNQLIAVSGNVEACVDLYNEVKSLPGTHTRGVIAAQLNISINGPISEQHKNILSGIDCDTGMRCMLKLLSASG